MIKVEIVCNSTLQIEKANEIKDKSGGEKAPAFIIYNENDKKQTYNARKLRNKWAARMCPFAIVYNDDEPIKGFWSEAGDVLKDLHEYLKDATINE